MKRTFPVRPLLLFLLHFVPKGILFSQTPSAVPLKVACLGDSITYGYGLLNPEGSYPGQLRENLPEGWELRNFGVNGACAGAGFPDSYGETRAFEAARRWEPDLILFMLGSNDSKEPYWRGREPFLGDYQELLRRLGADKNRTILLLPPPAGMNFFGIRNEVLRKEILPALRDFARKEGYPLVEFGSLFEEGRFLYLDNVHPNKRGYALMEERIRGLLEELYSEESFSSGSSKE